MRLSYNKQMCIYSKIKKIRDVRSEILILRKVCLIGSVYMPHIENQIKHLHDVSRFNIKQFKEENKRLDILHIELLEIKEKFLSYYDADI